MRVEVCSTGAGMIGVEKHCYGLRILTYRNIERRNIFGVICVDVLVERIKYMWNRFNRTHTSSWSNEARREKRVISNIRADIDERIAGFQNIFDVACYGG